MDDTLIEAVAATIRKQRDAGNSSIDQARAVLTQLQYDHFPAPTRMISTPDGGCVMEMIRHLEEGADGFDVRMIAVAHGYEATSLTFHNTNEDEALTDRYEAGDGTVVADWHPPAPTDGYILAAKFDTEDGPVAWFIRPLLMEPTPDGTYKRSSARAALAAQVLRHERQYGNSLIDGPMSHVYFDILAERQRQIAKGWTREHDDKHDADSHLAFSGAVYALQSVLAGVPPDAPSSKAEDEAFDAVDLLRPLSPCNHDKALSQREHLVRAAACIVAEIERIDRIPVSPPRTPINHPLPVGTRIISVLGEEDSDDDGPRKTGPNAEGVIIRRDQLASQGWTYDVVFSLSGVWVVLIESDPLTDPTKYQILPAEPDWQPIATAPRDWVGIPVSISLGNERTVTFRHGKDIRVRGVVDGVTRIVYIAQQSGFAGGEEPHWWDLSAEMPLGWAPTEWRELTAEERAKLDATDRED